MLNKKASVRPVLPPGSGDPNASITAACDVSTLRILLYSVQIIERARA